MERMHYLDFDLHVERAAQDYRVQVNSPAGQATHTFSLPFSDLELENFLLRLGHTGRGVRRTDSPEVEAAKSFGSRLFTAVFGDEVRSCLRSSLDEASRQDAGLRIRLRLNNTPELADLPWEYLYNPALNRFLALSVETPLVRYLELPERIRPLSITPPLHVLAMIASPKNHPPLNVEREWLKLNEALGDLVTRGLVALERLDLATFPTLRQRLRRGTYHILHFVGHGGFDQRIQDGVLILEDEDGLGHRVSGQDLGILLHDHRPLRLAILNACEGARGARDDPFAGTAQSLVQQGVPAVIAMQFEVTDEAAITLSHEFYGAVADGYSVDAALTEARRAIFAQGRGVEWGTPVLYMRAPDAHIFDVTPIVQQGTTRQDPESISAARPLKDEAVVRKPTRETLSSNLPTPSKFGRWMAIGITVVAMLFAIIAFVSITRGGNGGSTNTTPSAAVSLAATVAGNQVAPSSTPTLESTSTVMPTDAIVLVATDVSTSTPTYPPTPKPTKKPAPLTNTPMLPTSTSVPPTATPVPPTATPVPPTATAPAPKNIAWGHSAQYDNGVSPAVAIQRNVVVELHEGGDGALWSRVGQLSGTTIQWENSVSLDESGFLPSIAISDGTVVQVHQGTNGAGPLWYRVGSAVR